MIWAQLLAAVLAYRRQPWAWPRPRPPYLRASAPQHQPLLGSGYGSI